MPRRVVTGAELRLGRCAAGAELGSVCTSWRGRRPTRSCGSSMQRSGPVAPWRSPATGSTTPRRSKHADVAVAMGSGTAVAQEAADLVLGDDSFATLMYGLREGRRIIANVQKGLVFLLSTHVALLGFILIATQRRLLAAAAAHPDPVAELFIDLSTSVAFEREPEEPGAMQRPTSTAGHPPAD